MMLPHLCCYHDVCQGPCLANDGLKTRYRGRHPPTGQESAAPSEHKSTSRLPFRVGTQHEKEPIVSEKEVEGLTLGVLSLQVRPPLVRKYVVDVDGGVGTPAAGGGGGGCGGTRDVHADGVARELDREDVKVAAETLRGDGTQEAVVGVPAML